jgi:predicted dehydrogenase/threonine dehydrogenase-like Zn-dependent dehydrogenase
LKQILLKGGKAVLDEVPAPLVSDKSILVAVHYSCISVGTEAASMAVAAAPLYRRALKQPQKVRRAFEMMHEHGIERTIKRIRGTLTSGQPTGYSAAGIVVGIGQEVEKFKIGDRVACAGAGIANHAEVICVPVNLAVHVPDSLDLQDASTVTLGAIALQGIRRTSPTLGETVVVIGLGILGQLSVQLLKANGCRVIGVDPDRARIEIALACGMDQGLDPGQDDVVGRTVWATEGLGADAVIVTAAATTHEIISQAMRACRKKGRVILVGDVGLDLKREDFYRKELDFFVSTSYGPGRYDPNYEEGGQDYPLPYVRWTENRNMAAYLELLVAQEIKLLPMRPVVVDLVDAENLYSRLAAGNDKPLLAILHYPGQSEATVQHSISVGLKSIPHSGRIRVAVIGAGGFAQGMHLPNLVKLRDKYEIRWVVSRTGATAKSVAMQYGAPYAGTEYQAALSDSEVDLVLIATRHHLHAEVALAALKAGKHVLVEKPLALNEEELGSIEAFYSDGSGDKPVLITGFNRRYSPPIQHIKKILASRLGPMMISYRMNAGYLPPDHWVHGPEGGGRNVGEACHIYDLFGYLTDAQPVVCNATPMGKIPGGCRPNENFVATIRYSDGSVASLHYTSIGSSGFPKEQMEIYVDRKVITLDDYRKVGVFGEKCKGWSHASADKGQFNELLGLSDLIRSGTAAWSPTEQFTATRLSFSIEKILKSAE